MFSDKELVSEGFVSSQAKGKYKSAYTPGFKPKISCTNADWLKLPLWIQVCYTMPSMNGMHYLLSEREDETDSN